MWEISHEMERNLVHAGEIIKVVRNHVHAGEIIKGRNPVYAGVHREGKKSLAKERSCMTCNVISAR